MGDTVRLALEIHTAAGSAAAALALISPMADGPNVDSKEGRYSYDVCAIFGHSQSHSAVVFSRYTF